MRYILLAFLVTTFSLICFYKATGQTGWEERKAEKIEDNLKDFGSYFPAFRHLGEFRLDSVRVYREKEILQLFFNNEVSYIPLREPLIAEEECRIKSFLGWHYRKYQIELFAGSTALVDLVPNYFRNLLPIDSSHFPIKKPDRILYSRPYQPTYDAGLHGKHIALWPSHGRYYEWKLDRWEWQRARLHTTVEDLFPMSYVLPYLAKMLENAGAITFMPRERDLQRHEIIVDNDTNEGRNELQLNIDQFSFEKKVKAGFIWKKKYVGNDNPFQMGSYLVARSKTYPEHTDSNWVARYIPNIPRSGTYALYVSYGENKTALTPVRYLINTPGGKDVVELNQQMGAGTWIYLGHYFFEAGKHTKTGSIELISRDPASLVTLDAIKIGGGMGNIGRRPGFVMDIANLSSLPSSRQPFPENQTQYNWKSSQLPRYMEAARYFMQYAGIPFEVYSPNKSFDDYKDDYQSRGTWVNYLTGDFIQPTDSTKTGLDIPIDLCLAFHTDAGVTPNDSIVGTLAIYSSESNATYFPDGRSKGANRELSDVVQSQIVEDIRHTLNTDWTRRGLWNKGYSEAKIANTPTLLLELLSHQNLADMQYGLDPRFRFLVSRAIYKGILKYLSFNEGRDLVVQPLPVDHFGIRRIGNKTIELSWSAVEDTLEASAVPDHYSIEFREDEGFFQVLANRIDSNRFVWEVPKFGRIYSFRVYAANNGGISFPSETLSAGVFDKNDSTICVVNAFDRISGPAIVDKEDFAGIAYWEDQGVPDQRDICTVGMSYDFDRNSPWLDDDSPGWGASHANWEGRIITGNTFDFPYLHGRAIMENGYSFISCSDEYFTKQGPPENIVLIDLIFGEEKTTPILKGHKSQFSVFSKPLLKQLDRTISQKIPLFVSGAHIGTDMIENRDTTAIAFASDRLHFTWRSNFADRMGLVYGTSSFPGTEILSIHYNAGYHPDYYTVEAPDAIEPGDVSAQTIMRYQGSNASAGVASREDPGTIVLGFPFESILSYKERKQLMGWAISFLLGKGEK